MCSIKTWVGNCCGVAQIYNLDKQYVGVYPNSKLEKDDERNKRIISYMYNYVEDGNHGTKGESQRLSCYVLADRRNYNAENICDYIEDNDLGVVYRSPELDNTYSSHITSSGKSDSTIQVYLVYPKWDKIEEWYSQQKNIIEKLKDFVK